MTITNRFCSRHLLCLLFALGLCADALATGTPSLKRLLKSASAEELVSWGTRFEHGEGVERDFDAAIKCYCRAAGEGDASAQYQLGWMYANGRGVTRNDALAAAWFALAAENGDPHAQRMVARMGQSKVEPTCLRPNGGIYRKRLKSVPNPSRTQIAEWVQNLAPEYGLDPVLVLAVIRAESNFNPQARSPKDAQGLMQLIPATAKRFGVNDVWDPLQNLHGGMAYLRWLLDFFEGNEAFALAGYNAGEMAVKRYRGVPPYAETRAYVKRISAWRRRPSQQIPGSS